MARRPKPRTRSPRHTLALVVGGFLAVSAVLGLLPELMYVRADGWYDGWWQEWLKTTAAFFIGLIVVTGVLPLLLWAASRGWLFRGLSIFMVIFAAITFAVALFAVPDEDRGLQILFGVVLGPLWLVMGVGMWRLHRRSTVGDQVEGLLAGMENVEHIRRGGGGR